MRLVCGLADLSRTDLDLAGGKGANLGELSRAGFAVPPGFVLLTTAYRAFVAANRLQAEIIRLAAAADPQAPATVDAAAQAIRALFEQGTVPPEVSVAVVRAYERLGGGLVAVRSSATAEDLPDASFAGQQETYLNIEGPVALLGAVQRCWSSLWTPRAITYRARQGIAPQEVALAVVVQRLVEATAAGVLFTANPVTGRRDQMVIDGAWGLGEAVVSGEVTPDHWLVDGATGAVLAAEVGSKAVMTVRVAGGIRSEAVPPERQKLPVLGPAQVGELAGLGRRVAAHYGSPQDIEWALAADRLWLLQARPITSLFPLPAPLPPPEAGLRVYACLNLLQGLLEPFTPMGISAFARLARGAARTLLGQRLPPGQPPGFKVAAGRIYLDTTAALRHRLTRRALLGVSGLVERHLSQTLAALVEREPRLAPKGRLPVRAPYSVLVGVLGRAMWALVAPDRARSRLLAGIEAWTRHQEEQAREATGIEQRLRLIETVLEATYAALARYLMPLLLPALAARGLAENRLQAWLGQDAGLQPVLRSLPHNPTTAMDLDLWRLSRRLQAEGARPVAQHPCVQAFLARYGHRGVREIDVGMPRWADDPEHILSVLNTYLGHGQEADAERHFAAGAVAAEAAVQHLVAEVRRAKGWWQSLLLRMMLRRVRALLGCREYPKFYAVRVFALVRRLLQGVGAELVASGRLDEAGDVFFVELADIEAGGDLRARARAGRQEYERELQRRRVPRVITSEGETFYAAPVAVEGALAGTPASPGVYEGRVRVIHDPRGATIEPGEVLVAPGTDPAWTPLFLTAGALVMEMGGMMSHGSVVAREYGIPAVVGVLAATQHLQTGQLVRVDGEAGTVVVVGD